MACRFLLEDRNNKKVADPLSGLLKSDMEEILDTKNRMDILGFLRSGMDAAIERTTVIRETEKAAAAYDGIVVGTPVWASKMPPAAGLTFYTQKAISRKQPSSAYAVGLGLEETLRHMTELSGRSTLALLEMSQAGTVELRNKVA